VLRWEMLAYEFDATMLFTVRPDGYNLFNMADILVIVHQGCSLTSILEIVMFK
jgi:hypothetical protein